MIDGIGEQHEDARSFSEGYFANGCLVNAVGLESTVIPAAAANSNAVYDAARRWSQYVRMIPREQCVGYAVEDGKSILWFRRYAVLGGWGSARVEIAREGVSPEIVPILPWRLYEVACPEVEWVTYNGIDYTDGERFTGVDGVPEGYPTATAKVYLLNAGRLGTPAGQDFFDGIADAVAHEAPPSGWTNEWMLGCQWHAYNPSESSMWKPSAYSDYFPFGNRCHFMSPEVARDAGLRWHFSYGQRLGNLGVMIAESPSGYNYSRIPGSLSGARVNTITPISNPRLPSDDAKRNFFRSCRLYEPDVEIELAESLFESGEELVKVTLSGRLHNTSTEPGGAPESIDRDIDTWDLAELAAEPYRTNENALRAYLYHATKGTNFPPGIGDEAANSVAQTALTDTPWASIYPVVILTQLIPLPRADDNDLQDGRGTPLWHDPLLQMETYLRAMCEGYVDPLATIQENQCEVEYSGDAPADCTFADVGLYDYTFENLCLAAFGGRWIGFAPSVETSRLHGEDVRQDKPHGFGPLPRTPLSAEVFNQFGSAVDLLTHIRLDIPWRLEGRSCYYTGERLLLEGDISGDPDCGNSTCGAPVGKFAIQTGVPPATEAVEPSCSDGVWEDLTGTAIDAWTTAGIGIGCVDGRFSLGADRKIYEYRLSLVDADFSCAIPETWRDMVELNEATATLSCLTTARSWQIKGNTNAGCWTESEACKIRQVNEYAAQCIFAVSGTLDCGPGVPRSWYAIDLHGDCNLGAGAWSWLRPMAQIDAVLIIPLIDVDWPT